MNDEMLSKVNNQFYLLLHIILKILIFLIKLAYFLFNLIKINAILYIN